VSSVGGRTVIDAELVLSPEQAEAVGRTVLSIIARDYQPTVQSLATEPCHAIVLAGAKATRRWQQVVADVEIQFGGAHQPTNGVGEAAWVLGSGDRAEAERLAAILFDPAGPHRGSLDHGSLSSFTSRPEALAELCHQSALVQCGDDGWFYPGYVAEHLRATVFVVEDERGECTTADLADILFEAQWVAPAEPGTFVLAEHPGFAQCFGPAEVIEVTAGEAQHQEHDHRGGGGGGGWGTDGEGQGIAVKFFDGAVAVMAADQAVSISAAEHGRVVECLARAAGGY
jgi:hypothetical protein